MTPNCPLIPMEPWITNKDKKEGMSQMTNCWISIRLKSLKIKVRIHSVLSDTTTDKQSTETNSFRTYIDVIQSIRSVEAIYFLRPNDTVSWNVIFDLTQSWCTSIHISWVPHNQNRSQQTYKWEYVKSPSTRNGPFINSFHWFILCTARKQRIQGMYTESQTVYIA